MNYQMAHNVQFKTVLDGTTDPTFNFNPPKRVGFFPSYWTKNGNGMNTLVEKQIFFYAKQQFEKRGYQIDYIPQEKLRELPNGAIVCDSCRYDLVLLLHYSDKQERINFAGGSSGSIGWNQSGGLGSYSSTNPYSVPYYNLFIRFNMYSSGNEVWWGCITQGTSEPQILDKAENLVGKIFSKKFPDIN